MKKKSLISPSVCVPRSPASKPLGLYQMAQTPSKIFAEAH